jgi:hypothetical protein
VGAIGRQPGDFDRLTIVKHPCDWPSDDRDAAEEPVGICDSNAVAHALRRLVVAVMRRHVGGRVTESDRNQME